MVIGATLGLVAALAAAPTPKLTLEQAVQQVESDTAGHVLSAESVRSRHSDKYRIKVLTPDGRVQVVEVDANANKGAKADAGQVRNKETH